ncbi:MAG TPA: TolC family protein, partial [Nevskiaceae bacterium]|nr:TolC family protein [Nevskiaceae bacterium]
MNKVLLTSTFALTMLLDACVTAPADLPVAGAALEPAQLGLGTAPAEIAASDWWAAYGDAQLDRLMRDALARNPTLAQALTRVREAQSLSDTAHAGLLPSLSFDADETRAKLSGQDIIPPPYAGTTRWRGAEGLDLSWDLDFWGRQSSLLKQAHANADAAALDAAGARLAIAGAVLKTYIELDHQYALADVAQRSVQQREQT